MEIDTGSITAAYEDVRNDDSETNWILMTYDGSGIVLGGQGVEYDDFLSKFVDEERAFGYVRMVTGDEMSRRAKFAFITWIGNGVGALKKAKVSTDKGFVKEIIKNFSKEFTVSEKEELELSLVINELQKASGAAYGTGE